MATDEILPIRSESDELFEIGDRTIYRLQNQPSPFDADDLGTLIVRPHPKTLEKTIETATADPIARIEQKLDALMRRLDELEDTLRVRYDDRPNAPSR